MLMKNVSIKTKILIIFVGSILVMSLISAIQSIVTIKNLSNEQISNYKKQTYNIKQEELKNYVSLAINIIDHPIKPKLNGKDLNGVYLFNEMVKVTKNSNGGLVKYSWPKPGFNKLEKGLLLLQVKLEI